MNVSSPVRNTIPNAIRSLILSIVCACTSTIAVSAQTNTNAPTPGAAPPSAPAKRSTADLEKLVAPIALYPDPLIASVLPASAYPLEIVQAARFLKDTNNIAKLDDQPWDANVKAVARFPDVLSQMDQNIAWTSDLGDAFINQSKDLMDAVQTMRSKAQQSGALKTSPEQVVVVTNSIETKVVEQQTVYVTNQIVQIQPAQPEVIHVPQYSPTVVYAGYPAYPGYYPPYYPGAVAAASVVSFGAGMAMGAWLGNGCNWGYGDVDVDVNKNVKVNNNYNRNNVNAQNRSGNQNRSGQKWQPDQNRLKNSGSSLSSSQNRQARGYSQSGQAGAGTARSSAAAGSPGSQARSSAGQARASANAGAGRPAGTPRTSPSSSAAGGGTRSAASNVQRPSSSSSSAFNRSSGSGATRQASSRGSHSRGGGGGGGRGGGGRR